MQLLCFATQSFVIEFTWKIWNRTTANAPEKHRMCAVLLRLRFGTWCWCTGIHGAFWIAGAGLPWAADLIKGWHCSGMGSCLQQCLNNRAGFAESLNQQSKRGSWWMLWVNVSLDATSDTGCADRSLWVTGVTVGQCQRAGLRVDESQNQHSCRWTLAGQYLGSSLKVVSFPLRCSKSLRNADTH